MYKVGDKVKMIDADMIGTVVSVCISANNHVEYKVIWWAGGVRNIAWMDSIELEYHQEKKKKPGLVNYELDTEKLLS